MSIPVLLGIGWLDDIVQELALWGGVLLLLAGVLAFYQGWTRRRFASLIDETPRSDIAAVRSSGTFRVRGEIVPQTEQDTFTSPIKADENCVVTAWEIKEMYDTPKTTSWERAAWGVQAAPFYLSDGTEQILVDINDEVIGNETDDVFSPEVILAPDGVSIDGLRCDFETFDVHVETGYDESPPPRVLEFLEETDGVSADPMATNLGDSVVEASKRKYLEQTLQAGDKVSIVGSVALRSESLESVAHPRDLIFTQTDEGTLRLSKQSYDDVADGGGALLFSALTSVVGSALLVVWYIL